jgi:hypothetical protein
VISISDARSYQHAANKLTVGTGSTSSHLAPTLSFVLFLFLCDFLLEHAKFFDRAFFHSFLHPFELGDIDIAEGRDVGSAPLGSAPLSDEDLFL